MKFEFVKNPTKGAVTIYPILKKGGIADADVKKLVDKLTKAGEFEGKDGQTFFLYDATPNLSDRVLLVGFGEEKKLTTASVMETIGSAIKHCHAHHASRVGLVMPKWLSSFGEAAMQGAVLANYQPSRRYKTGETLEKMKKRAIETLEIVTTESGSKFSKDFEKALVLSRVVNDVRDWVNAPPNFAGAAFFENEVKEIAKETGAKLTILKKKEIEKLNMGALIGVNRGSPDGPLLVTLDYNPKGAPKDDPIVIVGKGILFDSGGYNLKPRGYIEDMHLDKAGAAVVIACIRALHRLGIKRRVVAVAPFTENLIGEKALKPSEILTTYSGKTVEITNTDAEGRLVLCDAMAYAIDTFKPKYIIDLATLTGACMVAIGDRYAGVFGTDKKLIDRLTEAGNEVDEPLWNLPLHKDFSEKMKGTYADLRNADLGSEAYAGASKGAAFLQEFVGDTKWAHIDIAGPAYTKDPKKYEHKGATGFGVRVMVRFLENL